VLEKGIQGCDFGQMDGNQRIRTVTREKKEEEYKVGHYQLKVLLNSDVSQII